ncbi:hypothetical protein FKP32DRAFT_1055321 [Trametes sanguinea]|nr:hypothetical protein FKP32DRAFT_1055321 [Trametes sanguinea]
MEGSSGGICCRSTVRNAYARMLQLSCRRRSRMANTDHWHYVGKRARVRDVVEGRSTPIAWTPPSTCSCDRERAGLLCVRGAERSRREPAGMGSAGSPLLRLTFAAAVRLGRRMLLCLRVQYQLSATCELVRGRSAKHAGETWHTGLQNIAGMKYTEVALEVMVIIALSPNL